MTTTVDLDTRMRTASASLRRASERLTPDGPPPRRGGRVAAVAAVAVLLVIAAGALALLRDDDDDPDVTTDPSGVPRLLPDQVPQGLAPTGAVDLPLAGGVTDVAATTVTVYGDPGADDPFAETDLGILVVELGGAETDDPNVATGEMVSPSDGTSQGDDGEQVTVRGHPGTVQETSTLGVTVSWEEAPGLQVQLASYTLDRDQLLAVADGLVVDGAEVTLGSAPPDLPTPLTAVGTSRLALGLTPVPVPSSADAHLVGYQSDDGDRSAVVTAFAGDASDLAVARWINGAHQPIDVRGHAGWLGTTQPATHIAIWEEAPGLVVVVQGFGLDEDEVRAMAESLRAASEAEWARLVLETSSSSDDDSASELGIPDGAVVRLQGQYTEGTWAVYNDTDGSLCGAIASTSSGAGACGAADAAVTTVPTDEGGPVLLFGVMPAGAVDLAGQLLESGDMAMLGTDRSYYGVVLDSASLPTEITFVDEQGQVVETVPVAP